MEKAVKCSKCRKFEVVGERGNTKEVLKEITCPYCEEPNEVLWPQGMQTFIRKVPSQM